MRGLALRPLGLENPHTLIQEGLCVCVCAKKKKLREKSLNIYIYIYTVDVRYRNRENQEEEGGVRAEQVGCQQMRQMLGHTGKHRHSAPGRLPPLLTSGPSLGQTAWSPWAMSLYKPCGKQAWRCAAF